MSGVYRKAFLLSANFLDSDEALQWCLRPLPRICLRAVHPFIPSLHKKVTPSDGIPTLIYPDPPQVLHLERKFHVGGYKRQIYEHCT